MLSSTSMTVPVLYKHVIFYIHDCTCPLYTCNILHPWLYLSCLYMVYSTSMTVPVLYIHVILHPWLYLSCIYMLYSTSMTVPVLYIHVIFYIHDCTCPVYIHPWLVLFRIYIHDCTCPVYACYILHWWLYFSCTYIYTLISTSITAPMTTLIVLVLYT